MKPLIFSGFFICPKSGYVQSEIVVSPKDLFAKPNCNIVNELDGFTLLFPQAFVELYTLV